MNITEDDIEKQISKELQVVDYDTHEFTIEVMLTKLRKGELYIPKYQRKFVWSENRKSKFIESLLINIPIPYLFLADTKTGDLEIVDGVQRLLTIYSFCKNDKELALPDLKFCSKDLKLVNLKKLTYLNGKHYMDLTLSRRKRFLNKTIRAIILSEKADAGVRFDLFERINTGSDELSDMEQRRGAYQGLFTDFVKELACDDYFKDIVKITDKKKSRMEDEELILRFFGYSDKYAEFNGSVQRFLDNYLKDKNQEWGELTKSQLNNAKDIKKKEFYSVLSFAEKNYGLRVYQNVDTKNNSRVRFEALAAGTCLALRERPELAEKKVDISWLDSKNFLKLVTTDGSNTKKKLRNRIEFVKNNLLEQK